MPVLEIVHTNNAPSRLGFDGFEKLSQSVDKPAQLRRGQLHWVSSFRRSFNADRLALFKPCTKVTIGQLDFSCNAHIDARYSPVVGKCLSWVTG